MTTTKIVKHIDGVFFQTSTGYRPRVCSIAMLQSLRVSRAFIDWIVLFRNVVCFFPFLTSLMLSANPAMLARVSRDLVAGT